MSLLREHRQSKKRRVQQGKRALLSISHGAPEDLAREQYGGSETLRLQRGATRNWQIASEEPAQARPSSAKMQKDLRNFLHS